MVNGKSSVISNYIPVNPLENNGTYVFSTVALEKTYLKGSLWKQQKSTLNRKFSLNQTLFNLFSHFGKIETFWNQKKLPLPYSYTC